jgi:hypothetical protein
VKANPRLKHQRGFDTIPKDLSDCDDLICPVEFMVLNGDAQVAGQVYIAGAGRARI